jgi:hypothetical protein
MKNNKVKNAVGVILTEQKNVAAHVAHLSPSEKRRVLMKVANECASSGYHSVMKEAIKLLGFRDEEVLIFATATIGGGRPQMVSDIVKTFCRDTRVARGVLGEAARRMISWAERAQEPTHLFEAIECVKLRKEKIGSKEYKGSSFYNQATYLAGFILWLAEDFLQTNPIFLDSRDEVVKQLREMVPDDADWQQLQKNKGRLGGPRK